MVGGGIHGGEELAHCRLRGPVDGVEAELAGHIHKHLVALRGDPAGQGFHRIRLADLLQAHPGGKGQQEGGGIRSGEFDLRCRLRARAGRGAGLTRSPTLNCGCRIGPGLGLALGGGRRGARSLERLGARCGLRGTIRAVGHRVHHGLRAHVRACDVPDVLVEDHRAVSLHVKDVHAAFGEIRQLQSALGQVGQGGGVPQANLSDLLHPRLSKEEFLGLDPPHRRGELPGQKLD